MVKLNKIYTRTGDDGTTGLVRGPRRMKHDLRIAAVGTVDESNASIGMARLDSAGQPRFDAILARVQNDLFDVGSDLATPGRDAQDIDPTLRVTAEQTTWIERQIDAYNAELRPLTSFILPGGTVLAARLHLSRTIVRRAERLVVEVASIEADVNTEAVKYLNRLSDLLFVLARTANERGQKDVLWVPGQYGGTTKKIEG